MSQSIIDKYYQHIIIFTFNNIIALNISISICNKHFLDH